MPDRSYPNVCGWAGKEFLAFIRRTICPEANSSVKREMKIFGDPVKNELSLTALTFFPNFGQGIAAASCAESDPSGRSCTSDQDCPSEAATSVSKTAKDSPLPQVLACASMQLLKLIPFIALTLALTANEPCQAQTKKATKVGISVQDLGNPFFVQIVRGAEAKIKDTNPSAQIASVSCNYDVARQTGQIDDFINAADQLVILNAANSEGIAPAVRRLKAAKIPVIAVDVSADGGVDATVMSDNRQAGQKAGQYIADRLKGKGQVVIINGDPVSATLDRVAGVVDVLQKYPEIKMLSKDQNGGGTRDGGLRVMTDLLTAFPQIDAVFAVNDPSGIGADLAARQAKRTSLFIAAVDGSPDAVTALKDPQSLFAATAAQDPYAMAQRAVEVGVDVMNAKKLEQDTILIPVELVTRDNVKDYKGWTR